MFENNDVRRKREEVRGKMYDVRWKKLDVRCVLVGLGECFLWEYANIGGLFVCFCEIVYLCRLKQRYVTFFIGA